MSGQWCKSRSNLNRFGGLFVTAKVLGSSFHVRCTEKDEPWSLWVVKISLLSEKQE